MHVVTLVRDVDAHLHWRQGHLGGEGCVHRCEHLLGFIHMRGHRECEVIVATREQQLAVHLSGHLGSRWPLASRWSATLCVSHCTS